MHVSREGNASGDESGFWSGIESVDGNADAHDEPSEAAEVQRAYMHLEMNDLHLAIFGERDEWDE